MTQVLEITLFHLCLVAMQTEKLRRWLFMLLHLIMIKNKENIFG